MILRVGNDSQFDLHIFFLVGAWGLVQPSQLGWGTVGSEADPWKPL